jgi:S-adenosylmethionine:tRNA ribosyltransferase-isomerase
MTTTLLDFELPRGLEAADPPEERGLRRDSVRLMVASRSTDELVHATFAQLPDFLAPGDLVVVNTSATIPAAIEVIDDDLEMAVHLSTRLTDEQWVVEPRRRTAGGTERWSGPPPPLHIPLAGGAAIELLGPYLESPRLWTALLELPEPVLRWLDANGQPIRYAYVPRQWPLAAYQNVYAAEPGSAEMPSAGRPFTERLLTRLVAKGIAVSPIVLHTGVASLEAGELPYPERAVVPRWTADSVNATRRAGGRVVAVGTTVVRALESASTDACEVAPFDGWTDLIVTPARGLHVVDGLITGWHEPQTSHLQLIEAVAGADHLALAYDAAIERRYLWHEFGDSLLVLP